MVGSQNERALLDHGRIDFDGLVGRSVQASTQGWLLANCRCAWTPSRLLPETPGPTIPVCRFVRQLSRTQPNSEELSRITECRNALSLMILA